MQEINKRQKLYMSAALFFIIRANKEYQPLFIKVIVKSGSSNHSNANYNKNLVILKYINDTNLHYLISTTMRERTLHDNKFINCSPITIIFF